MSSPSVAAILSHVVYKVCIEKASIVILINIFVVEKIIITYFAHQCIVFGVFVIVIDRSVSLTML